MSTALANLNAIADEDKARCYPNKTIQPILATDVAREIKSIGGTIWLIQKPEYGFLLRAEFGKKQFRVVLKPITGQSSEDIPAESSPLHVVDNLPSLRTWLQLLSVS